MLTDNATGLPAASLTCASCAVSYVGPVEQRLHYKTEFHRYNAKRKAAGLPPKSLAAYVAFVGTEPSDVTAEKPEERSFAKAEKSETTALDDGECFFCAVTFSDTNSAVAHMKSSHSFFVPYAEDLENENGFFDFIRHFIGVEHTCVTCEKSFESKHAVRKHMIDKSHISVNVEDIAETWQFYVSENEEMVEKGTSEESNGGYLWKVEENATLTQLTLPSGIRVSHRNNQSTRKRALSPSTSHNMLTESEEQNGAEEKAMTRVAPGHVAPMFKRQAFSSIILKQRRELQRGLKNNQLNTAWCSGGRLITVKCKV